MVDSDGGESCQGGRTFPGPVCSRRQPPLSGAGLERPQSAAGALLVFLARVAPEDPSFSRFSDLPKSTHTQTWCGERAASVPAHKVVSWDAPRRAESSVMFQICVRCASLVSRAGHPRPLGTGHCSPTSRAAPHVLGSLGRAEFWEAPGSPCSQLSPTLWDNSLLG